MARRSTPPASPQRPSLARHRWEVDRLLAAQIQAGKDIQQKYVGSHLYLVSNKMWRSYYKKEIDGWREYNLELLRIIFTDDQTSNDYDSSADALLGGDIEKDDRLLRLVEQSMDRQIATLESIRARLDLYPEAVPGSPRTPEATLSRSKVFLVHGHDEGALQATARFLQAIGLQIIILREEPDQGRTTIEKFEACAAEVGFAVVLLTPDDLGGAVAAPEQVSRVRQNVVFELGYFVGSLGRGRACLLRKGNVEIPSDLFGVIYTDFDHPAEGWKVKLARELKAAKFEFDSDKVLG